MDPVVKSLIEFGNTQVVIAGSPRDIWGTRAVIQTVVARCATSISQAEYKKNRLDQRSA